jgi:hypothetical protein
MDSFVRSVDAFMSHLQQATNLGEAVQTMEEVTVSKRLQLSGLVRFDNPATEQRLLQTIPVKLLIRPCSKQWRIPSALDISMVIVQDSKYRISL